MQAIVIAHNQDEKDILTFVLRKAGLAVASSSDLQRVLANWSDHPADIMVVALAEGQQPMTTLETVRATTQVPLLMIVEPLTENTLCQLLQNGADGVLGRPVSPQVLAAHAQALSRRTATVPAFVLPTLELDEIILDPSTRTVTVSSRAPQRLTQLEFRLLYVLMTNRGHVIPFEAIIERVWGYTGEGSKDLIRGLVSRLRQKIEPDPKSPHFLETVSGIGYRFAVDDL